MGELNFNFPVSGSELIKMTEVTSSFETRLLNSSDFVSFFNGFKAFLNSGVYLDFSSLFSSSSYSSGFSLELIWVISRVL